MLKGMTFEEFKRNSSIQTPARAGSGSNKRGGSIDLWKILSKNFEDFGKNVINSFNEKSDDL